MPEQEEKVRKAVFGDVPEGKKRKFILVEDSARDTRVRVRVQLEGVQLQEIPDSYRQANSVYPRSYFPIEMTSPPVSPSGRGVFDDVDTPEDEPGCPVAGVSLVPVPALDGDVEVPAPRLTKAKREKEITLNELGYRMSWCQSRVFAGRRLFLQKSCKSFSYIIGGRRLTWDRQVDAYRNKMRTTIVANGQDLYTTPHFETRVGKRRWSERGDNKKAREGRKRAREISP
jgi:hypothetical protein